MPLRNTPSNRLHDLDRPELERHFLALGPEDRRLRFGAPLHDDAVRAYVARINFDHDEIFAVKDDELELVGVVHVAFAEGMAELGLSVRPSHRGKGVGGALFERMMVRLRNRGVESVFVHCLGENQAMLHLARKHGMHIAYEGGESDARQALKPATPATMLTEWTQNQHAQAAEAMRQNALFARRFFMLFSPLKKRK